MMPLICNTIVCFMIMLQVLRNLALSQHAALE